MSFSKLDAPVQIALAWLLARLEENLGAAEVQLLPEELFDLNASLAKIEVAGYRYPAGSDYAKRVSK